MSSKHFSSLLCQTWAFINVAPSHWSSSFWIKKLQILFKGRGRNTITPVVQYNCGWLCRRQHTWSTVLSCIAHYYCWHEWRRGYCRQAGWPADASFLAFAFQPSVLGQMHAVPVRQNRGSICTTSCFYCEIFWFHVFVEKYWLQRTRPPCSTKMNWYRIGLVRY